MEEEIKDGKTTEEAQPAAPEAPPAEAQPEASEAPPAETPPAEPPAEEIKLELPEGSKLPQSRLDEIASYAKEHGLSKDVAQKMLESEDASIRKYEEGALSELSDMRKKWVENLKSDKKYGGANFEKTVQLAQRTLKKFAPQSFIDLLNQTGYGDNDDLIKTFADIGSRFAEDTLIGRGVTSPDNRPKPLHERLYPNHKE